VKSAPLCAIRIKINVKSRDAFKKIYNRRARLLAKGEILQPHLSNDLLLCVRNKNSRFYFFVRPSRLEETKCHLLGCQLKCACQPQSGPAFLFNSIPCFLRHFSYHASHLSQITSQVCEKNRFSNRKNDFSTTKTKF